MNILILIILVAAFLGLLVLIPLLIIKAKASMNSASVTLGDAWKLYLHKSARKPIFHALSIAQKNDLPITLEQIETHWFASGDPIKIMNVLANNSENKELTFQILSAIDLTGKDVEQLINAGNITHTVDIKNFRIKSFWFDYQANYKLGLFSAFNENDSTTPDQKIREKLNSFALTWDSNDPIKIQNFLRTNILTTEYWERVLNAQLIDQNIHVKI